MNRTVSTWVRTRSVRVQRGFTLVELLVVIAIIGLLAGLTVPAVFGVRGAFNRASVKFEVQALNDAVENYRTKYGDYPPDGSSWQVMESHLRKAFPNILQSELNLLNPSSPVPLTGSIRNDCDTSLSGAPVAQHRVMDPAEALVFFLGGFSSDKQRPFTGPGGPFVLVGGALGYNGSRQNSFFDFPTNRLTLAQPTGIILSTDEVEFGLTLANICTDNGTHSVPDLMPVFMCKGSVVEKGSPYVYFDSRTYQASKGSNLYFNFYQPSAISVAANSIRGVLGAARPFLSEQVNAANNRLFYENKQSFQIVAPGSDGKFGGRIVSEVSSNGMILFTSKGKPTPLNATAPVGFGPTPGSGPALILPEHGSLRPMSDDTGNFVETNTLGENTY